MKESVSVLVHSTQGFTFQWVFESREEAAKELGKFLVLMGNDQSEMTVKIIRLVK